MQIAQQVESQMNLEHVALLSLQLRLFLAHVVRPQQGRYKYLGAKMKKLSLPWPQEVS